MQRVQEHTPQDRALSFQRGEEAGFNWFFRQLYPSLTFFAFKITADAAVAEEIASTAFIRIWERHCQFSAPENIRSYLYQVVKNDALKWLQKEKRASIASREAVYSLDKTELDHFQHLVTAEMTRQLHASMQQLPPECSRVFRLLYIEGKSIKETARELQLSPSTVKTQKARGLALLRTKLATLLHSIF